MPTESAKTFYLSRKILDHCLAVEHFTQPAAVYLALFPTDPGDAMTSATELSGSGYARTQLSFSAATTGGVAVNSAACEFPTATADWGSVAGWAIYDAATGGSALYHGAFETARTIYSGDACRVNAGELSITEY